MKAWTRVPGLFRDHEIGPLVAGEPLNDWRVINGRLLEGAMVYEVWWRDHAVGEHQCVTRLSPTFTRATCAYLADGMKIVVARDQGTIGAAWLEHKAQGLVRPAGERPRCDCPCGAPPKAACACWCHRLPAHIEGAA